MYIRMFDYLIMHYLWLLIHTLIYKFDHLIVSCWTFVLHVYLCYVASDMFIFIEHVIMIVVYTS